MQKSWLKPSEITQRRVITFPSGNNHTTEEIAAIFKSSSGEDPTLFSLNLATANFQAIKYE